MKIRASYISVLAAAAFSLACSSSDGEGTIIVTSYGESFIEDGIPAAAMADGWEIDFGKFDVSFEDINVGGQNLTDIDSVDLSESSSGEGQELGSVLVSEGDHTDSSFSITRVDIQGEATKDDVTKTFHWVFEHTTNYHECETTTSVDDGGSATFQITVHADHLFYDSLVAEEPELLFGPLADADENDDGEITEEELANTDIGAYDPGSEDGIDDLWAFLNAQTKTLGHVDGEGHCHAETVD
jgi:hypothetical protein